MNVYDLLHEIFYQLGKEIFGTDNYGRNAYVRAPLKNHSRERSQQKSQKKKTEIATRGPSKPQKVLFRRSER